ncbi:MAG: hypothetical protein Kilf2KO_43220 [Rhodospirillales bacterium]
MADSKTERAADALRRNLKRRKEQARARRDPGQAGAPAAPDSADAEASKPTNRPSDDS